MAEDMSNVIEQINHMIKNNEIPSNIKDIIQNFTSNSSITKEHQNKQDMSSDNTHSNENSSIDFDITTILKMKQIMDSMKLNGDDPRANLLKSLKPYLKPSRKEKVDQYIQFFWIGKIFEILGPLGGDIGK